MNRQLAGDILLCRQTPPPPLTRFSSVGYTFDMVKLKSPLISFKAVGRLGSITFLRRRHTNIAEKTPIPPDVKSLAQLSWRHMYQKAVVLWHALSPAEKADWESQARSRHMTGFAWFMSQALKPNPGLYLPLQGGSMTGDIIMSKYRILKLPVPTDSQEAASKTYVDTAIAAKTASGSYAGDSTVNRGIPHGLSGAPKIVFLGNPTDAVWYRIITGLNFVIYSTAAASGGYTVIAMDATNFYVGNADEYNLSANLTTRTYYWVAVG